MSVGTRSGTCSTPPPPSTGLPAVSGTDAAGINVRNDVKPSDTLTDEIDPKDTHTHTHVGAVSNVSVARLRILAARPAAANINLNALFFGVISLSGLEPTKAQRQAGTQTS